MREVFLHGPVPNKNLFQFSKIHLHCSGGAPEDNDKNRKNKAWQIYGKMTSKVSSILSYHDTCVKYERGFCAWIVIKKNLFQFSQIHLHCSEGAPKDNDKNRKNKAFQIYGKMASKVSSILPNRDTCVKYERGFLCMDLFSTKTSFIFHKFTSSCSEGAQRQ
jgi:hypothetical protein